MLYWWEDRKIEERRLRRLIRAGLLAMMLLIIACIPACECSPIKPMANTMIRLVPSKNKVEPGEQFTADIVIEPAPDSNIAGVQLNLGFNTQAVQVDDVVEGDFLSQGGAQTFFNPGDVDNLAGTVAPIWGVVLGSGQTLPTAGVLATVKCTAVNASTSSAFVLTDVIVGDANGNPVPFELSVGQVVVAIFGDVTGDGVIDVNDIQAIAAVFGSTGDPGFSPADVDESGVVNVLDAIVVGQLIA